MEADFLGSMTNWLFKNSKIAPQTVWVAAGINNCFRSQGYKSAEAANQIFDIVRLVKFYSPQTRVVIQGVLPTSYPYPESEQYAGMYWNDTNTFPMHHCVKDINKRLRKFVKEYRDHCVEYADLDNVVISDGGQFKSGVLGDGLHFRPEPADMNSYCEAIARAVEPFNNGWVRARSEGQYVEDVEPLYFEGLEGPIYYRWKYGEWSPCTGTCGEQRRSAHCYRMEAGDLGSEAVDDTFCQDVFLNPLQRVCDFSKDCLSVFNVVKESLVQLPGSMVLNTDFNQRATEPVREPCPVAQVLDNRISMGLVAGVAVVAVCLLAALLIALHNWRLLKYAVEESKVTTAERDIIRRKYPMGL